VHAQFAASPASASAKAVAPAENRSARTADRPDPVVGSFQGVLRAATDALPPLPRRVPAPLDRGLPAPIGAGPRASDGERTQVGAAADDAPAQPRDRQRIEAAAEDDEDSVGEAAGESAPQRPADQPPGDAPRQAVEERPADAREQAASDEPTGSSEQAASAVAFGLAIAAATVPSATSAELVQSPSGGDRAATAAGAAAVADLLPAPPPADELPAQPTAPSSSGSDAATPVVRAVAAPVASTPASLLVVPSALAEAAAPADPGTSHAGAPGAAGAVAAPEQAAAAAAPAQPGAAAAAAQQPNEPPASAASDVAAAAAAGSAGEDGGEHAGEHAGGDASADGEQQFFGAVARPADPAHAASADGRTEPVRATLAAVPAQLGKAVRAGARHLEIALDPAALGRVDVRLEFGQDGRLSAMFIADSREALQALRADVRALERALADAGVRTDAGSLGFSLRQQDAGAGGGFAQPDRAPTSTTRGSIGTLEAAPAASVAPPTGVPAGRLDIRA
jgi:flagellar hook-length control protein FliK